MQLPWFPPGVLGRAKMEDEFLKKNLSGYAAHASHVPVGSSSPELG